MTLEELLGSLTPCSQHYLHSRARAYGRGLRFVGEDRVNRVLNEVVRRNELPRILLSGEELEEEAARVVPRPTGYPPPYNAERASASSAAPLFGHEEASGERGIDTLPMPLPSQGQTSSMEDVSSGGRPSQFVPETWSDFDAQGAYLQAENDPEDGRYVADPAEEPDEFEDEPIGPFAGPHPYQWTEVTERVALLWLQDPPGTASELRTVQPDLFWRDLEDDPLLYHIVTEHPDPPPHRVYEQGQLVTVIRHWVRGGLHHTLCVLDIPEVNPWFLAEETRYVVLRSRYSPGGDFVHLLPVAARAAAVRVPEGVSDLPEISGQGEIVEGAPSSVGAVAGLSEGSGGGQDAVEAPSNGEEMYTRPQASEALQCPLDGGAYRTDSSTTTGKAGDPRRSLSLLQDFCKGWGGFPGKNEGIDWDSDLNVVPSAVSKLASAVVGPEDREGIPDEYDLLVCEVPVESDETGVDWLDHAQARLQAVLRTEGRQCLEEAVVEDDGWMDSCFRLRSVARQVEAAIEDLEHHGRGFALGKVIPNHMIEREIGLWIPSMKDEYNGLLKAVDPLSEQTVREWERQGREFELIPSKLIFSVKAPDARRKCRSVCCGNFTSGTSSREDKYSGGIDSVTMRCLLRFAGMMRLNVAVIDVKQAFLLAPLLSNGVPVVVKTPHIFRKHGICEERFWVVRHALYGLVQAPRSWSVRRDSVIADMKVQLPDNLTATIVQLDSDPNVWAVKSRGEVQAWIAIYVDDLMVVGETPILESVLSALMAQWKCTPPRSYLRGRFRSMGSS